MDGQCVLKYGYCHVADGALGADDDEEYTYT